MSSSRRVGVVLLSLLLFTGACSGSTTTSAPSKDAGATGGAAAGGAAAGGGGVTADAAAGGAGTAGAIRDAATGGAGGTADAAAGGATASGGAAAGDAATGGAGGIDACAGSICRDAATEADAAPCTAGTSSCAGNAVVTCNSDGSGIASTVPCGTNEECTVQGTTATCRSRSCTPGTKTCQAGTEKVLMCADDGVQQDVTLDCSTTNTVCVNGACVIGPVVCVPGTQFCGPFGSVEVCGANGDSATVVQTCFGTQPCNHVTHTCTARPICTPNQPVCDGTVATTCSADGTAYVAGGTRCEDAGEVCYKGTCEDCWATTYFCSGSTVRHCAADGASSTLTSTCTSSEYCDSATAACKAQICSPNHPVCNGESATTCNADGLGFAAGGTTCTDTGKFCYQGACASLACAPGRDYCSGSTVRHCAADGTSSTLTSTCTSSQYCDSATATCEAQVCTPNQPVCNDQLATTCNADGSGYLAGGTGCGGNSICSQGSCLAPLGCPAGKSFCWDSKTVVRCTSGGLMDSSATCTSSQYCDSATCKPLLCTPNHPICNGNTATLCSADGLGFASGGTPCGAQCCVSGICRNGLFGEDFEDGALVGWQVATGGNAPSISATYAAAGTLHSLMHRGAGISYRGVYRTFAGLKPNRVSWWVMTASSTAAGGYFVLTSAAGLSDWIAFSYFKEDGTLVLSYDAPESSAAIPYTVNVWYHIELRDFDWTAKTFDYYVNETLIRAAAPFRATSATDIRRLDLYSLSATSYWDEITFD